jgi:hypothetical protein
MCTLSLRKALAGILTMALLLGATLHIDEQLDFTIKGDVACLPRCSQPLAIYLIGKELGDNSTEREIIRASVGPTGGPFVATGSILVGHEGKMPAEPWSRTVTLEVRSGGCSDVRKSFQLSQFVRDKYGYLLDVGRIALNCGQ